ncbi:MAG: hypothetical protein GF334_07440 [Candidatus Altiarchaeales archaeon]|nr:hypothetical protein [Candidatus Altiarchaeales archaeon]
MNLAAHLEGIVSFAEDGIGYSQTRGYASAFMSAHDYNTSQNYSRQSGTKCQPIFRKTGGQQERPFYSKYSTLKGVYPLGMGAIAFKEDRSNPRKNRMGDAIKFSFIP